MKLFNLLKKRKAETPAKDTEDIQSTKMKKVDGGVYDQGVRFPWCAGIAAAVGLLSEVVDAMFMSTTLASLLNVDLNENFQPIIISYIVGAGCFISMAWLGFQRGNLKYYSRKGAIASYIFWITAGLALVASKILAGIVGATREGLELNELLMSTSFLNNLVVAIVQLVLYIGTGFLTRDSVQVLTNKDMREYFLAKRKYDELLGELADNRQEIIEDISILKSYPKYAERLNFSKRSVKANVRQYNEAARALIEAEMAMKVEPDLMEDMYDKTMKKEKNYV